MPVTTEHPPLATTEDVVAELGRALSSSEAARADAILAKASELFRRRSGQLFTAGRSVVKLKVNGGEVRLSQRPATTVHTVTDEAGNPVTWSRHDQVLTVPLRSHQFVTVDYEHGADDGVPDVVRLCIAQLAARVLSISDAAAKGLSASMRVRGPFTTQETYAAWAQGRQTMLAPEEAALADSFRQRLGATIVPSS